ncbi:copper transpport protein [Exophiala xenobiotica]|uniref:Copper transport protein n=1 Tax=Lithohypha guttulata TaxID=1690604 RepID=A0ABR0KCZ7_9EURO|nr:copper transpport protein [Lithohypha guttulata]KAK5318875.1 copper transpport protein [Exophiala xenobiotica]
MDHSGMNHGDMGHGDMDMGGQCSMNMIFTWDSTNLCIIFRQWRITGTFSLLMSLIAIVVLTAGYEGLRRASSRYEVSYEARMSAYSSAGSREAAQEEGTSSWLIVGRDSKMNAERQGKMVKALLYALQVFYSFFIM